MVIPGFNSLIFFEVRKGDWGDKGKVRNVTSQPFIRKDVCIDGKWMAAETASGPHKISTTTRKNLTTTSTQRNGVRNVTTQPPPKKDLHDVAGVVVFFRFLWVVEIQANKVRGGHKVSFVSFYCFPFEILNVTKGFSSVTSSVLTSDSSSVLHQC